MKKTILSLVTIAVIVIGGLIGLYKYMDSPVSKSSEVVTFEIKQGTNKSNIIKNLAKEGLIKSELAGKVYLFLHSDLNMQAGTYNIDKSKSMSSIIGQISGGKTNRTVDTFRITFKEGKTIDEYATLIGEKICGDEFDSDEEKLSCVEEKATDFKNTVKDKEYVKTLIDKYWFLTDDILASCVRYPLEGYLFPETYEFYVTASSKDIIKVLLNQTEKVLNKYKDEIESSNYTVHEIITMASIVEKEANSKEDRKQVAQVIYKRLAMKMNLGMDVTAFYGAGLTAKEFDELRYAREKKEILNADNPYNTRNTKKIGLPIGAICNPSDISIEATLNPAEGSYVYFYAVNGKDYFFETSNEFYKFINSLK